MLTRLQAKAAGSCGRIKDCGHACGGVVSETTCLPCYEGCDGVANFAADNPCMVRASEAVVVSEPRKE
jgi:hypothetical protein